MNRPANLSTFLFLFILAGCIGSTGPNESCEDFDRQEQADYLEEHAQEDGVTVTDSGLQYTVIEEGDGDRPTLDSTVSIEYEGKRIDGSRFLSTQNPQETNIEGLIDGLEEGILLMNEGSTYEFVIPSDLGYGETSGGDFCPGATLIFEVTLVEIVE